MLLLLELGTPSQCIVCLTSAVELLVIKAMKFQVAEMTIYPLSFDKTNCDHLIYEPHNSQ